jgi:hypothetical protein
MIGWLVVLGVVVVILAVAVAVVVLRRPDPEPAPLESGEPREAVRTAMKRKTR